MDTQRKAPTALVIVAVLFVVSGIYDVLDVLISLTHSKVSLSSGVLGVFVGPGLLRFRPGWRTCALVFTGLGLVSTPLFALFHLKNGGPVPMEYFHHAFGFVSPALALLVAFIYFMFFVWQYRVLTREEVVRLFYGNGA